MSFSESAQPPEPAECTHAGDLGKMHHDSLHEIWYECVYDTRRELYTWTILPPNEDH